MRGLNYAGFQGALLRGNKQEASLCNFALEPVATTGFMVGGIFDIRNGKGATMISAQSLALYGPIVIIAIAVLWGLARVSYLARRENVAVLSFLTRKKTIAETMLGLIAILFDGYLILRPFWPEADQLVFAFESPVPVFGVLLMAIGIGLMIISQIDMGKSWRIGVPKELEDSQSLITSGVYSYSRNPIYLAIMMFLIGGAVVAPGPFTIGAVLLTYIFVRQIIEREETFLEQHFGDAFKAYRCKVRRWL